MLIFIVQWIFKTCSLIYEYIFYAFSVSSFFQKGFNHSKITNFHLNSYLILSLLYQYICPAITKYTRRGNLLKKKNRNLFLTFLKAGKLKIKKPADSVSPEDPFLIEGSIQVSSHSGRGKENWPKPVPFSPFTRR